MAADITPDMARAELARRRQRAGDVLAAPAPASGGITPEQARAELARRRSAAQPVTAEPEAAGSGLAMNLSAGANEGLYAVAGAPVDLMRGAMNLGIGGYNAATGSDVAPIPENSFGGSRFIAEALGAIRPELDPQNTVAATTGERLARAGGQGAGYAVAPVAALGAASRAGIVAPQIEATATRILGGSGSTGEVAGNAAIGAVSGVGAEAAMEATPDTYDPVSGMAGGMAAGGAAVLAGGVPGLVRTGGRMVSDFLAPMTQTGRERIATDRLRAGATDIQAVRDTLEDAPADLISGSAPTTGQVTGDLGILALERGSAVKRPEAYAQRRADQNTARIAAFEGVQQGGAPEKIADAFRNRIRELDNDALIVTQEAQGAARASADNLGAGLAPDAAGARIRSDIEDARSVAKTQERALYDAVDPSGTSALSPVTIKAKADEMRRGISPSAQPATAAETQIYTAIAGYGDTIPLREVMDLKANLRAALAEERRARGETPAYRRMSIVNDGIFQDLDRVVRGRLAKEDGDVRNGRIAPENTIAARLNAVSTPSVGDEVFTPAGRRVGVRYELAEGDSLIASSLPDGRTNPAYPSALQPRDRSRAASDAQIAGISRNLQPARLGASTSASEGAPIVGMDGVVESGNGRTLAIRRAYADNAEGAAAYREYLQRQGYDTTGYRQPVLVRRRVTELPGEDRVRFTQEANASSSMAMSASEQAKTDASRMNAELLSLYRGGDIGGADNRDFTRAFLRSVPDRGQEGAFVTGDGSLSVDGAQRVRNALLFSAYRDPRLVASLADEGDENIRSFGRALSDISGDLARLRSGVDTGRIDPAANVAPAVTEAARVVQNARARNVRLADAVAQQDAFNRTSPEAMDVLRIAYGDGLNGRLSRERLGRIMRSVVSEAEQQSADARLFGEALNAGAILQGAKVRYGNATIPATADPGLGNAGAGGGQVRPGERGLGGASDGPQDPARGRGSQNSDILDRPALVDNFDGATRDRLKLANAATADRAERFDNKTLAPLRARASSSGSYELPASQVPARLFHTGAKAFDDIQRARSAVGDEKLLPVLRDYAVDRARRAALNADGTFDPSRLNSFRRSHADALRAIPGLDEGLSNAARAAETLGETVRRQNAAVAEAQKGALAKLAEFHNPEEATRTVGSIFAAQDAGLRMRRLRAIVGDDTEAQKGLRQAVVDHMRLQFVENTEAGTSGLGTIKGDGFQNFVRRNGATLKAAGFTDDEVNLMRAIGDDIQQANRSIAAVKNPGDSNSAEKLYAANRGDKPTVLSRILSNIPQAVGGVGGFVAGGPIAAIAGAVGAKTVADMRLAGMETVEDILADALLNPGRARILLSRPSTQANEKATVEMLGKLYRRSVAVTGAVAADGGNTEGGSVAMSPGATASARRPLEITIGRSRP